MVTATRQGITRPPRHYDVTGPYNQMWLPPQSGEGFAGPFAISAVTSSQVLYADYLYARPVVIPERVYVDAILLYVSTAEAGKEIRPGIWRNDYAASDPGELLIDAGAVSIATTGVKVTTFADTQLVPGVYWLGFNTNSSSGRLSAWDYRYQTFPVSLSATSYPNGAFHVWSASTVTYGALPDPFGSTLRTNWSEHPYQIWLRAA